MRSKGKFSVNKFAREHFDGGGHDNAAGGKSEISLDATISKFLKYFHLIKMNCSILMKNKIVIFNLL